MQIKKDFPLSNIFYYKLKNTAKYVLEIENKEDLIEAISFVHDKGFYDENKFVIAGSGSNLIFKDDYYDGAILHFNEQKDITRRMYIDKDDKTLVHVFAGEQVDALINFAFDNNLAGAEWAGGLPGTVGGAVRGNAGAFGEEIKDMLLSVEVLKIDRKESESMNYSNKELGFGYRQSIIKSDAKMVVLEAVFKLKDANDIDIKKSKKVYEERIGFRNKNHPMEYPSCGSVFKNINNQEQIEKILTVWPDLKDLIRDRWHDKVPIGYLNKRLKLAGLRSGNMQISEKHSNFIVNLGSGLPEDTLKLIEEIKYSINKNFGFVPETEVEII